jgi:hypothetical protein
MKVRKVATVLAVVLAGAVAAPASAHAAEKLEPVLASYHGQWLNLAESWGGAQVCADVAIGDVRCYDSDVEADRDLSGGDVGTAALAGCPSGWVCLWADANYGGRRLRWSRPGTYKLATYGFRDQASSAAVNRIERGVECVDYRTGLPDPRLFLRAGGAYRYLNDWNDRIDEIKI